ncbi:fimbria/pilus outer membrane usher protein [Quatrionicoccus australiensis]|uniref:hypothetical protein n=1 Tax=Quatrionicoccus australiensis TaxID=138118 RepID=UPI001CF99C56|nr:hypothetical protein [Quatrionicoccus australiensis]MCB4359601.1 fimbrial biogenesis outer membrane usher protein [Quatrionicoccus australiensis]
MRTSLKPLIAALALALAGSAWADDMLLSVSVTGMRTPAKDMLVHAEGGRYFATDADLGALGLTPSDFMPAIIDGVEWRDLHSIGELVVNPAALTAALKLPVEKLPLTVTTVGFASSKVKAKSEAGAFVNYTIGQTRVGDYAPTNHVLLDGNVSTESGWLVNSVVGYGTHRPVNVSALSASLRQPDERTTLRLGSSYTSAGSWGAAGRFVGVQYRTDRSLNPGHLTSPSARFDGLATAVGSAQLYVDGRSAGSTELNAGPFQLDNLRLPYTGGGTVSAVVTDASGAQQVITTKLIGAPYNLRAGLAEYAVEAGMLQRGTSLLQPVQAAPVASLTYARGVTDYITLEGHAEGTATHRRLGATGTYATAFGTLTAAIAAGDQGQGVLTKAGYAYSSRAVSLAVQAVQPGKHVDFDDRQLQRQVSATASYRVTDQVSLVAAHATYGASKRTSLGVNASLTNQLSVSVAAERSMTGDKPASGVFAMATYSFDRVSTRVTANRTSNGSGYITEALQLARRDYTGVQAQAQHTSYESGMVYDRVDVGYAGLAGEVSASVGRTTGGTRSVSTSSVQASGAVVLANGAAHLARTIYDSYAIVELPVNESGVPVMHNHRVVAETNSDGIAIAPAAGYVNNTYTVASDALPATILATSSGRGAPFRGAPTRVVLPVKRPGVIVDIAGATAPVLVMAGQQGWRMADGGYYIEDLQPGRHSGRAGSCAVELTVPDRIEIGTELKAACL